MPSGKVKISLFFGLIIWVFSFSSCGPKLETIPYVYVDKYLSFTELAAIGPLQTYAIKGVGVSGIVLFNKGEGVWEAFDLTCMYKPRSELCKTPLTIDKSGWLATCACCKSVFNIFNEGYPQSGPAQQGMHQYHVSFDITGTTMHITN